MSEVGHQLLLSLEGAIWRVCSGMHDDAVAKPGIEATGTRQARLVLRILDDGGTLGSQARSLLLRGRRSKLPQLSPFQPE